jgi:hypothetical protein
MSLGVCRFPLKFVGVAVVDLVFRVYTPLFCSAPDVMGILQDLFRKLQVSSFAQIELKSIHKRLYSFR